MKASNRSRKIKIAGTVISVVLFTYLLIKQDWTIILKTIIDLRISILVFSLFLYISAMVMNSIRWYFLLRIVSVGIPFLDTIRLAFVGAFTSNFLPSTIGGDAIRFFGLLKYDHRKELCLSTIIMDRFVSVFVMMLVLPVSIASFYPQLRYLLGGLLQNSDNGKLSIKSAILFDLFNVFRRKIVKFIRTIIKHLQEFLQDKVGLAKAIFATIMALFFSYIGTFLLAREMNINVNLIDIMSVSAIVYLFSLIPISINGIGLRELIMTTLYSSLGASIEQASVLSIISRILMVIMSSIGSIWLSKYVQSLDKIVFFVESELQNQPEK